MQTNRDNSCYASRIPRFRWWIGIAILLFTRHLPAHSDSVPASTALQVARNYLSGTTLRNNHSAEPQLKLVYAATADTRMPIDTTLWRGDYFVIDIGQEEGFIIVAGDDRMYPVLGIADRGHFDLYGLPGNMQGLLEGYQHAAYWLSSYEGTVDETIRQQWKQLLEGTQEPVVPVKTLNTACWGQGTPFNAACPVIEGVRASAGCGPVAAAILCHYHRFPSQVDSQKTPSEYLGLPVPTGPIDWDHIRADYNNTYSLDQIETAAIGNLLWQLGANMQATYTAHGTKNDFYKLFLSLLDVFSFSPGSRFYVRDHYKPATWYNLIRQELEEGFPVLYYAASTHSAHEFIIDGFDSSDAFHINWGWNGHYNGYFRLDALHPDLLQEAGDGSYAAEHRMLCLHPADGFTERIRDLIGSQLSVVPDVPSLEQKNRMSFRFENAGNLPFRMDVGVGLCDRKGTVVKQCLANQTLAMDSLPLQTYGAGVWHYNLQEPLKREESIRPVWRIYGDTVWHVLRFSERSPVGLCADGVLWADDHSEVEPPAFSREPIAFPEPIRYWVTPGQLHLRNRLPGLVRIWNLWGQLVYRRMIYEGDSIFYLGNGIYFLQFGSHPGITVQIH